MRGGCVRENWDLVPEFTPEPNFVTRPASSGPGFSIAQVGRAVSVLEGRWKLLIVHRLFVRTPLRFFELERAIPWVIQKMLIQ
jgi:DNA-binding HxlR family transcriptional regulator